MNINFKVTNCVAHGERLKLFRCEREKKNNFVELNERRSVSSTTYASIIDRIVSNTLPRANKIRIKKKHINKKLLIITIYFVSFIYII